MSDTLMTDYYQLSMYKAYMESGQGRKKACFEYFFRKYPEGWDYLITAGLRQVVEFIQNFSLDEVHEYLKFPKDFPLPSKRIDMYAVPEGTKVLPGEPIIQIMGDLAFVQLLETRLLNLMNYQSLVATKAHRICKAANGKPVLEFGLRRAQCDGGNLGSRAAYIGGCAGTSNVLAGKLYGIPVSGTHAHSWVMSFDNEIDAFREFVRLNPDNACLLLDTYSTLESGLPNAIKVFKQFPDVKPKVRIDSGDMAYLSKRIKMAFREEGMDVVVIASNDLDEYKIKDLEDADAEIDIYACGTNLITVKDNPALGGVYKLVAIENAGGEWVPKGKNSEDPSKATKGGIQQSENLKKIFANNAGGLLYSSFPFYPIDGTRKRCMNA